ncbi:MAG: sulfur carrier protein ThiS [Gemmatimonadaceae bacterium]
MTLLVNGAERHVAAGSTLADLLAVLEIDPRVVVVEHNGVIMRDRSSFATLKLGTDDTLEIVHFVGGG